MGTQATLTSDLSEAVLYLQSIVFGDSFACGYLILFIWSTRAANSAEHIPAFLIPQYLLMFVSMTALNANTLQALF